MRFLDFKLKTNGSERTMGAYVLLRDPHVPDHTPEHARRAPWPHAYVCDVYVRAEHARLLSLNHTSSAEVLPVIVAN